MQTSEANTEREMETSVWLEWAAPTVVEPKRWNLNRSELQVDLHAQAVTELNTFADARFAHAVAPSIAKIHGSMMNSVSP